MNRWMSLKIGRREHIYQLSELSRVLLVCLSSLKYLPVEFRVIFDRLLNGRNALGDLAERFIELVEVPIKSGQFECNISLLFQSVVKKGFN